ncbi:MAG: helix-turn-helix domain-containing protein [Planctomycetes bacterium]|nr:helix-turn-helix domain-containing protein [Planctomycetota bacterium]
MIAALRTAKDWLPAIDQLIQQWRAKRLVDFSWPEPPQQSANFNSALTINWSLSEHWLLHHSTQQKAQKETQATVAWSAANTWILRGHGKRCHFRKIEIYPHEISLTDNSPHGRVLYNFTAHKRTAITQLLRFAGNADDDALELHSLIALAIIDIKQALQQNGQESIDSGYAAWLSMCDYIQEHFHQDIDRRQLAQLAGIHPNHVSRIFKRFGKQGFSNYLQTWRVQQAAHVLKHSTMNLDTIAQSCGLSDATYLNRCFKKHMGCTPGSYRSQYNPKHR